MDFTGKTALVTGASVGIGRATAILLARGGAKVALVDLDEKGLEELVCELRKEGASAEYFVGDVSDEARVSEIVAETEKRLGGVDILVNNAALWRHFEDFERVETALWRRFTEVNLFGTVYFTRAVLPAMKERGWGRIINVSSVAGVYGNGRMACYSATKGAVNALTRALAKETAAFGVTVNSVCPGTVSPSSNHDMDYTTESGASYMGRTGSDRENASLICYLATEQAGYLSGQCIQMDGCRKQL